MSHDSIRLTVNRAFSHDVTAPMLVFQNKETAAMLVFQTNPLGIELYFYANSFFCFIKLAFIFVTWVKTLSLYSNNLLIKPSFKWLGLSTLWNFSFHFMVWLTALTHWLIDSLIVKCLVFKCFWQYAMSPRAFENNSLCKIWGANKVPYEAFENRE